MPDFIVYTRWISICCLVTLVSGIIPVFITRFSHTRFRYFIASIFTILMSVLGQWIIVYWLYPFYIARPLVELDGLVILAFNFYALFIVLPVALLISNVLIWRERKNILS